MINQIIRWAASLIMVIALCIACYDIGKSRAKIKIVEKEKEVIRYVEKEKAKIASRPNAGRDELVRLFKSGVL